MSWLRRSVSLLGAGAVAFAGAPASAQVADGPWEYVQREVIDRVQVSGWRRLGYHSHLVTGDREAFDVTNYGGLGGQRFTDLGQIRVTGTRVLGTINFDFNILDSRFTDPQGQKFSIDYARGPWEVNLGDIRGRLTNTNQFARMDKTLRGASVGYRAGGLEARYVESEVRGQPVSVSMPGTNSAGPYFLQSSQIVRGSEQIEVDGVLQKFGTDYSIDYDLGAVTFVNRQTGESKLIPPTSTIVATYESYGFIGQRGRVEGAGLSYDMGAYGRIGLTAMRQVTGGVARESTRQEFFQGFGPPSTPYFLQFEPIVGTALTVRADGVLQAEGADYRRDGQNRAVFYFNRFMPATTTIDVIYTPTPTNTVDGDRETIGVDYRVPLGREGRAGYVSLSTAAGRLTNAPVTSRGTARGAEVRYATGPVTLRASARDVPSGYVSVESTGFSRNERAHDLRVDVSPSPEFSYGLSHRNSSITTRQTGSGGRVTFLSNRFTSLEGFVESRPSGGQPWSLTHQRLASRNRLGPTTVNRTELSSSQSSGRFTARYGVSTTSGTSPRGAGLRGMRDVSLQTLELATTYRADDAWNFRMNTNLSRVASEGKSGVGRDVSAGVFYRAGDQFSSRLQYTDSDAGALSALGGFSSGFGFGFDGNGFTGNPGGDRVLGTTNARVVNWSMEWAPSARLALHGSAFFLRTQGAVTSNAETASFGVGADYDVGQNHFLSGSLNFSRTRFIGSPFRSSTTTAGLFLDASPPGRLSYRLGGSVLLTGGDRQFAQDSFGYELAASYNFAPRQTLVLGVFGGTGRGYLAQGTMDAALTYQYQIWRSLALNVSYRIREVRNLDPLAASGAYRSRGFDVELAFNFGS